MTKSLTFVDCACRKTDRRLIGKMARQRPDRLFSQNQHAVGTTADGVTFGLPHPPDAFKDRGPM